MIMQIFENEIYFLVFLYYHFSKKKAQNKNKVGIKATFLMMKNTWSEKPYTSSLSSRAGRKDFFLERQTTNTLNEQMSSRKNIDSDPIAATRSDSNSWKARRCYRSVFGLQSSKRNSAQCHNLVPLDGRYRRSPPSQQFLRYRRRWSGLDKVPFKQKRKQLCVLHRNQIKLQCSWSLLLRLWLDK